MGKTRKYNIIFEKGFQNTPSQCLKVMTDLTSYTTVMLANYVLQNSMSSAVISMSSACHQQSSAVISSHLLPFIFFLFYYLLF
jgi:hypothetical protein